LQTLLTIASQHEGALEMLKIDDVGPLIETAGQNPLALSILNYMWINSSIDQSKNAIIQESINKGISTLVVMFAGTDAVTFLNEIGTLLQNLDQEVSLNLCLQNLY